ncbi:Type 1 glutamine amidotransferase-like domain-containing protein [Arthrobacter zhaoguopingii]|uniref:Type 1 glutamine amidotransferase-like domain-containing protein n=1 Tax=Arthrobacter zhaoguopingii TaxID=2681491 RepID=UPI001358D9CF|nr:Type 1 glutamine amidotransferase-like domain-containing protein [Arthrobacter zhaoguopingii]
MRLYLSSYQLGSHPEVLSDLVRGDRRGWVILNALDGVDDEVRHREAERQIANLQALGLAAQELDLRKHDAGTLAAHLGDPEFLWVRGGNVFMLRAAMALSGMDEVIVNRLEEDAFVYAGFSAGACILGPTLSGLEECDSTTDCLATYGSVRFDGLNILDRPLVPHIQSPEHPESEALTRVASRYDRTNQPYWPLRDGQALVIHGSTTTLI